MSLNIEQRVKEKKDRRTTDDFTPEQKNTLLDFQDISREADTIAEVKNLSTYILKDSFGYNSNICLIDKKNQFPECEKEFTDNTLEEIVQHKKTATSKDGQKILIPILGKNKIMQKIEYPANEKCVLGVLIVENKNNLSNNETEFLRRYAGRIGMAIHQGIATDRFEDQNEFMMEFTKLMGHDIKNALVSMGGFSGLLAEKAGNISQYLKEKCTTPNEQDKAMLKTAGKIPTYVQVIRNSEQRIGNLVELIRFYDLDSEFIKSTSKNIPLKDTAISTIEDYIISHDYLGRFTFILSIDDELKEKSIMMPPSLYTSILENLVGNSVKQTPEGGTILLGFYKQNKGNDKLVIDSINTAKYGLSEEKISKLGNKGERFAPVTGKSIGLDQGVGLYMIHKIVNQGFGGDTLHDIQPEIDISPALDESKKFKESFGKDLSELNKVLKPYFRTELRFDYKKIIS